MKRSVKNFVLSLPGPDSYCDCKKLCSRVEIEHVCPKSILKFRLPKENYIKAINDPHNLYRCCSFLNCSKGSSIIVNQQSFKNFSGVLSRAFLYMNFQYKLKFDSKLVYKWIQMSEIFPPEEFEFLRSSLVTNKTGEINTFIEKFKYKND